MLKILCYEYKCRYILFILHVCKIYEFYTYSFVAQDTTAKLHKSNTCQFWLHCWNVQIMNLRHMILWHIAVPVFTSPGENKFAELHMCKTFTFCVYVCEPTYQLVMQTPLSTKGSWCACARVPKSRAATATYHNLLSLWTVIAPDLFVCPVVLRLRIVAYSCKRNISMKFAWRYTIHMTYKFKWYLPMY